MGNIVERSSEGERAGLRSFRRGNAAIKYNRRTRVRLARQRELTARGRRGGDRDVRTCRATQENASRQGRGGYEERPGRKAFKETHKSPAN